MNQKTLKHVTDLIEAEVSFFNGWGVSKNAQRGACENAAKKVVKYLSKRGVKAYRDSTGITPSEFEL